MHNATNHAHLAISTLLAFALIPLSGFATDIYIPSFPAMAEFFGTTKGDVQLSLIVFVVASGIAQLFVGSLLDRFGRYRLTLASLLVFALSSFAVAFTDSLSVLLAMRVIQGVTVALIVVGKRAFFMDVYSGSQLKHYTSLFAIIWSTAPIIAPFLGGFLQQYFEWQSNFYFLGWATAALLVLEVVYGNETLRSVQSLRFRSLFNVYSSVLRTPDFSLSVLILGLCFANILLYNMASPFIIEQVFHLSPVVTGNASLLSGVAVLTGGLLSKYFLNRPILHKISVTGPLLVALSSAGIAVMYVTPGLVLMIAMVMLLHVASGFTFNTFYTYALGRFTSNAGIVGGITGGGMYIVTSLFSYTVVSALHIQRPVTLALGYLILAIATGLSLLLFAQAYRRRMLTVAVTTAVAA